MLWSGCPPTEVTAVADRSAGGLATRLAALDPDRRRRLVERLRAAGSPGDPLPVPRDGRPLPASFIQERLWLVDQLLPGSTAYLLRLTTRIHGELDADLLGRAVQLLTDRHEVLRTSLAQDGGRLVQVVHHAVAAPFRLVDLSSAGDGPAALQRELGDDSAIGFDLGSAPLLRVRLLRLADTDHVLTLVLHHAITDGWSNGILLAELATVYAALRAGREPELPPVRLQYADVAAWEREQLTDERLETLLGYWGDLLTGAPELLALPTDEPRRSAGQRRGARRDMIIPAELAAGLRGLARTAQATPFMVLLAGLAATLSRWSGVTDVVIGSPHSGRSRPALEGVLGPLVGTVVLRLDTSGGITVQELIRRARYAALGAREHGDLPFERLVERLRPRRTAAYNPVFQVNLGVGNFPQTTFSLPGTAVAPLPLDDTAAAKFDLSVYVAEGDGDWSGLIEYNADLFRPETIDRLAGGLCEALSAMARDPDRRVDMLPVGDLPIAAGPPTPADRSAPVAGFVPLRDRWERDVALVWSQVLGVTRVGATDDFFGIGGHSMAGMLVVDRLRQLTGRRVGLATLFEHPTVERLAGALRAQTGEGAEAPFVVELQPYGTRPPLVFMPTAVGEVAVYFPLARLLRADRPLYGVQPDGFFRRGDPGDLTLQQMAACYAEEIARACPAGPYHLCGFSAAGRLAVAVAAELARLGRAVGALVLLDSAPFGDVAPDPDLATVLQRWLPFAPPADELRGRDRGDQVAAVLAAGQRTGELPPTLDVGQFGQWCRRLELGARALAGHGPLAYPGTVTLFCWQRERDIAIEWRDMPIGELVVQPVDVDDHLSFVEGPKLSLVAQLLAAQLDTADAYLSEGSP
jgi:thioesterase domain-containing protein